MGRNRDIKKVLVVGSGPIVIGQGAEFDYSGTQACEALREEGVETVLINSNPATIMTDREQADHVYIEPITPETVEEIIRRERPDSFLAGMGGQTGLNMALTLQKTGILEKYGVKVIGTSIPSIEKGEDRELFRSLMEEIGEPVVESRTVNTLEEAVDYAAVLGYPVVVRPAFTLGGTGGGIAYGEEELRDIVEGGLHLSLVHQVLIERCISGWKEIEYEVIRDSAGNSLCVCNMENIDPVGVHTGDSIVVAPTQTLSDKEHVMLRRSALKILDAVGIEGGCNVQFALEPHSFQYAVIEINPRVSRSSALASKATGYPIAKVATKIALGYRLDEIRNEVTKTTTAAFEPAIDYVVVKIPKWPFDKFFTANRHLGTKMMATGEVMAIGSTFQSALLKGLRSLELKQFSLRSPEAEAMSLEELKDRVTRPDDRRLFYMAQLLRVGYDVKRLARDTGMDEFFLWEIKEITELEKKLCKMDRKDLSPDFLRALKQRGFSDKGIGDMVGASPDDIYQYRKLHGITGGFKMVDTCAGEVEAKTPYYYSTYDEDNESVVRKGKKVVVIGAGPIRIGQGIEFDYSGVHCVRALKKLGIETIIINNNPETVSTDFDISDKLYFEPLTEEDTLNVLEWEKPDGVILQFGGQTAIKLAGFFEEKKIPILGTGKSCIDLCEDREQFDGLLERLHLKRPKGSGVRTLEQGLSLAELLGYPVLVRPSFVLGGQGMEICHNEEELSYYLREAFLKDRKNPVLIDRYIEGMELEVDAICDGKDVFLPGIMEHLERAGVHSGDSISIYPPGHISPQMQEKIYQTAKAIAVELKVRGMLNIQYIIAEGELYIIEVNPRSSRTVPYLSKVTGIPMVELATRVMLGESLESMGYVGLYKKKGLTCVKVPVFSTEKLHDVEVSLGPEMRSTGEVLGVGKTREEALAKGFLAAGMDLSPGKRKVLVTLRDKDKEEFLEIAKMLKELEVTLYATEGTGNFLRKNGIPSIPVRKVHEASPNLYDAIKQGTFDLVINTPTKGGDGRRDGFLIRRGAIESGVEIFTNLDKARAYAEALLHPVRRELYELKEY